MKRIGVLLIIIALLVGTLGCPAAAPQYELSISSSAGGEVTTPGEGAFTHEEGTTIGLVAEAEEGYRFVDWTGDADTIANINDASTTITMDGNYSITANFVAVYSLSLSSAEGGSVTTPGQGTFSYDEGTVVGLVVAADVGYRFLHWIGDVASIADIDAASTTITMDGHYSIAAGFEAEEAVFFADPNLDAAIREAIDVPERPIYLSDLEGLTELSASGMDIDDLSGLEYAKNLAVLNLERNQISDISPLANLTSLRWLDLYRNQIGDISPLANLTNLTWLHLPYNQIDDISPLADLTKLTGLYLGANLVGDISPLANLTNLTELEFCCNQLGDSDLLHLANLTNLTGLYISSNEISDISPLSSLANLTDLDLWNNQLSDISPLANLARLNKLHLQHNQICDISPLANLTRLGELWLDGNQIDDVTSLANLTALTGLSLAG